MLDGRWAGPIWVVANQAQTTVRYLRNNRSSGKQLLPRVPFAAKVILQQFPTTSVYP